MKKAPCSLLNWQSARYGPAPRKCQYSQLNTQPMVSPVNASRQLQRTATQESMRERFPRHSGCDVLDGAPPAASIRCSDFVSDQSGKLVIPFEKSGCQIVPNLPGIEFQKLAKTLKFDALTIPNNAVCDDHEIGHPHLRCVPLGHRGSLAVAGRDSGIAASKVRSLPVH